MYVIIYHSTINLFDVMISLFLIFYMCVKTKLYYVYMDGWLTIMEIIFKIFKNQKDNLVQSYFS